MNYNFGTATALLAMMDSWFCRSRMSSSVPYFSLHNHVDYQGLMNLRTVTSYSWTGLTTSGTQRRFVKSFVTMIGDPPVSSEGCLIKGRRVKRDITTEQ